MSDPETYTPSINTDPIQDQPAETKPNESEASTPKKEEKPVEKPKSKIAVSKTAVVTPKQNTNVDKIQTLIGKFEETFNKREDTIGILINICNFLNITNDPKVFQTFAIWFMKNSSGCMGDEVALRGIHTIQNKRTKTRVEATHQCFMEMARVLRSRTRTHYRFTVRAMKAMEVSERLALWLIQRCSNN